MSRHILSLSPEQLTAFDLDALIAHTERLNQHHYDTFTTAFPKAPSRWLSHYQLTPHPLEFTPEGDIDGGFSWLVGATLDFSLIQGDLLSTDGQLEPAYSRYKGCTSACKECQAFKLTPADRQALGEQLQSGAKRLQITCPFPEVVQRVRQATAKKGAAKDPMVALLEIETVPEAQASAQQRQLVGELLDLTQNEMPPLRLTWCHLSQDDSGEIMGRCSKMPSDSEAKIGVHVDNQHPDHKERSIGGADDV